MAEGDGWKERQKAQEESYFDKKNKEALAKLARRDSSEVRKSPITGEPMEQVVLYGVTVDRCRTSGGIWLDKGELEAILAHSGGSGGIGDFFSKLLKGELP